jgi:hypothetical protein
MIARHSSHDFFFQALMALARRSTSGATTVDGYRVADHPCGLPINTQAIC